MSEAISEFANLQNLGDFGAVAVTVEPDTTPVRAYLTDNLNTADILAGLSRESWMLFRFNRAGNEWKASRVVDFIGADLAGHSFVVREGCDLSGAISYDSEDFPTFGKILYAVDETGEETKEITITSTGITGISDPVAADYVFQMARRNFAKTGLEKEIRSDMQKLNWIYTEEGAVAYLINMFKWSGADSFSRKILTVSFDVVDFPAALWEIGEYCKIDIPTVTNGFYGGVITGVKYSHGGKDNAPSAEITARVAQIKEGLLIHERGIGYDKITERGNAVIINKITEIGVD
jgi:hypothetical protein